MKLVENLAVLAALLFYFSDKYAAKVIRFVIPCKHRTSLQNKIQKYKLLIINILCFYGCENLSKKVKKKPNFARFLGKGAK